VASAKPKRTLAVFHLAETSGPSRSLEAELRWLADDGSVEVVLPGGGAVAETFGEFARITVLPFEALTLPRDPLAAARAARRVTAEARTFRALIRKGRPDLVVIASALLPAALLAAHREGVPAIVYAGELFPGAVAGAAGNADGRAARALKGLGGRAICGMVGSLATAVLACSNTVARQYSGARRAPVTTLYPPIGDYSGGDPDAFRSLIGIDAGQRCVTAIGNITENRGQDVLIRALPVIRDRVPDAHCVIVGDPHPRPQDLAYRERLHELARQLRVADAVTFAGHLEAVADVYAAAEIVVNPRRIGEAFGRVPCEALVAGRPVVAMREGAVPEVLRDGETALLAPPGDPGAIAEAVVRLLRDGDLVSRLVTEGRRDVARRFSPERSLAEFKRAVMDVTARYDGR
jgi:glycosyltransferase involved in cell wall biosynthesis